MLAVARLVLTLRPQVYSKHTVPTGALVRLAAIAGVVAAILVSPMIGELARMAADGALVRAPVTWRSSPPGLDVMSFILPNPMHMGVRPGLVRWLDTLPGGWAENIASVPFVGLATILAAWRLAAYRPSRLWMGITIGFGLLAMGPFLRIAGVGTSIPLPWAFLRYLPVIGDARMPQRLAVVAILGFAVLFTAALAALGTRYPRRRPAIVAAVGVALGLELLPAPRNLHVVRIPEVYQIIAADPRPVRVLSLPYGIRDGLSSFGNFNPASQVFQTVHEKSILGGYLSRVPPPTRTFHLDMPMLASLAELSEGRTPSSERLEAARLTAPAFIREAFIGYVVIDTSRTSAALEAFAVEALDLVQLSVSDQFVLHRPRAIAEADVGSQK